MLLRRCRIPTGASTSLRAAAAMRHQGSGPSTLHELENPFVPDPDAIPDRGDLTDGGRAPIKVFAARLGRLEGREWQFVEYMSLLEDIGIYTVQDLKAASEQKLRTMSIPREDVHILMKEVRRRGAVKSLRELEDEANAHRRTAITTEGMRFDLAIAQRTAGVAQRHHGVAMKWLGTRTPHDLACIVAASACRWPLEWTTGELRSEPRYHVPGTTTDFEALIAGGAAFVEDERRYCCVVPAAWWYGDAAAREGVAEELEKSWGIPLEWVHPDPHAVVERLSSNGALRRKTWARHVAAAIACRFRLTCEALELTTPEARAAHWVSLAALYPTDDERILQLLARYEVCLAGGCTAVPTQLGTAVARRDAINVLDAGLAARGDGRGPPDVLIPARRAKSGDTQPTCCVSLRCHLDVDRSDVAADGESWARWLEPASNEFAERSVGASGPTSAAALAVDAVLVCEQGAQERTYENNLSRNPLQRRLRQECRFAYCDGTDIMTMNMARALLPAPRPAPPEYEWSA